MAETVEGKAMLALFARVSTLSLSYPVAYPNLTFSPPASKKYLRVQFLPNTTDRPFIGSNAAHRFQGLLQVSVYWPLNKGEDGPRQDAGAIAEHFPADLMLDRDGVRVRITKRPSLGPMLIEDTAIQIPVSIQWEAFH